MKIVRESLNFERGQDPKEALFGIRPGILVTNDRIWNGHCIMIEVFLRTPNAEDFRKWDPLNEHSEDKYLTYQLGMLQDIVEDVYGPGKDMPSTFFPSQFTGFDIIFQSMDLRKLTQEESEIVLRGIKDPRHAKNIREIYEKLEKWTGVKVILPKLGKK